LTEYLRLLYVVKGHEGGEEKVMSTGENRGRTRGKKKVAPHEVASVREKSLKTGLPLYARGEKSGTMSFIKDANFIHGWEKIKAVEREPIEIWPQGERYWVVERDQRSRKIASNIEGKKGGRGRAMTQQSVRSRKFQSMIRSFGGLGDDLVCQ